MSKEQSARKSLAALVDKKYQDQDARALSKAPVDALRGVSPGDAHKLAEALQIRTIADLASHWSVKAAQAIFDAAQVETAPTEPADASPDAGAEELSLDPRAAEAPPGELSSNLSAARYGYDFVVAVTQTSINATMKAYLDVSDQPTLTQCCILDDDGNLLDIDLETLLKNTGGVNPFEVPGGTAKTDPRVKALSQAGFAFGFRAQLGLPLGYAPTDIPDIVTLGANTASVGFKLLCSTFDIAQASYGPRGISGWMAQSQPEGGAWTFNTTVDLRLTDYGNTAYDKLPPDVQKSIKNLGGDAFSIQQLLFDFQNAGLQNVPTIEGVDPGTDLYAALQKQFVGRYFTAMQQRGEPVLGYSIKRRDAVDTSTLKLTDLTFNVNPYVGSNGQPVPNATHEQLDLCTLNYLCAANHNPLPPATLFAWNWLDPSQRSDHDGVVAINRNTLAEYFRGQLLPYVKKNCYTPNVTVNGVNGSIELKVNYSWGMTPGQEPTIEKPATGEVVLRFSQSAEASDTGHADGTKRGEMKLKSTYSLEVTFKDNTIILKQNLVIYTYVLYLATSADGNILDKTITDTYTLTVDQYGGLGAALTNTKTDDNSKTPDANDFLNFWANVESLSDDVKTWAQNFISPNVGSIPLDTIRSFVFPGARTFTYKDVVFSSFQDLLSRITYIQPS